VLAALDRLAGLGAAMLNVVRGAALRARRSRYRRTLLAAAWHTALT